MIKGTVKATDGEAAKALSLAGEGTEGGVDVGVRQRKHVVVVARWWLRLSTTGAIFIGWRIGITVFAMHMGVTHFCVATS